MKSETTCVVTGAARGQGAAHAALLGRPGVRIILTDVLHDDGEQTAALLRSSGTDAHYRALDVTSSEAWQALAAELRESDAPLTGLVNNAGILRYAAIEDTSLDMWSLHERVNVHGPLLGMQALAPIMAQNGGGSIVNVSSTAALRGTAGYAAYSASKAAVIALTKVAAIEYAPLVRVNVICPGGVSTPMNDYEPPAGASNGTPLGRRATVEEISPLIEYLISGASSFVTGSTLTIDGGLTA